MSQWVQYSEWLIPAPVLIAIAWVRFNSPPTNRSGTTFALFVVGLTIYCLLIVALWLLIIVAVSQGSIGFGKLNLSLSSPKAQAELAQHAPLVAAFILVAATHFSWVRRMDNTARAFCIRSPRFRGRPTGSRSSSHAGSSALLAVRRAQQQRYKKRYH